MDVVKKSIKKGDTMQKALFKKWLENNGHNNRVVSSFLSRCGKIERELKLDLDKEYMADMGDGLLKKLKYSADDELHSRPVLRGLIVNGNIRNILASLKSAAKAYMDFKKGSSKKPISKDDVAVDGDVDGESAVACVVITDGIHLSHFMSQDKHRRLFFQTMEVRIDAMITVGRREDIHAFEEVKTKEQQEKTNCGKDAHFYFTNMFHKLSISELAIRDYFSTLMIQQSGKRDLSSCCAVCTLARSVSAAV